MIIALVGKAGSGKSTAANCLVNLFSNVRTLALADPLKAFVQEVYRFTDEQMYGPSSARNAVDPRWGFSPRKALQTLGTEWGRALHPDTWIELGIRNAQALEAQGSAVVITDCRFLNEAQAVWRAGGSVWKITRNVGLSGEAGQHPSETEQDEIEPDLVIDNSESIDVLTARLQVAGMLAGLKL